MIAQTGQPSLSLNPILVLLAILLGAAASRSLDRASEGPSDTDREIGASFDRRGRATRPVVDPRVSFRSAFSKAFRPLSRPTGEPSRQGSGSSFDRVAEVPCLSVTVSEGTTFSVRRVPHRNR